MTDSAGFGRCRFCSSERIRRAFAVGDRNRGRTTGTFVYMRCAACGSLSLTEVPDDLGVLYGGGYFAFAGADDLPRVAQGERWRIDEFVAGRVPPGGTAIEIGPGTGHFAHLLRQEGFDVHAVDRDASVCRYLRDVVGAEAHLGDDPAAALDVLPGASVIALWHVLEHLPDPASTLRALARRLLPGGIAVIAVPNTDSLGHRVLGRRWAHIDAPRHLVLPPPRALLRALTGLGLTIEAARTDDPGARHYNWFAWDRALRPLGLPERVHHVAARALTRALRRAEAARGSSLTVVARRPPGSRD